MPDNEGGIEIDAPAGQRRELVVRAFSLHWILTACRLEARTTTLNPCRWFTALRAALAAEGSEFEGEIDIVAIEEEP